MAAERKAWAGGVRARYARRLARGGAEFTLLRGSRETSTLLKPLFLRFQADFHPRSQDRRVTAVTAKERILALRETFARQQRETAPPCELPPAGTLSRTLIAVQPASIVTIRESREAPARLPGKVRIRTVPPALERPRSTLSLTQAGTRQEAARAREAFRREESDRARPRVEMRLPARAAPAQSSPQMVEAETVRTAAGAAFLPAPALLHQMPIEAIADQVIGQIDRRLTAHRERMGRR